MKNENSFREYLNRNVNILTIVGIFNALAIYATSAPFESSVQNILSLLFLMLSISSSFPMLFEKGYKHNITTNAFVITLTACQTILFLNIIKTYSAETKLLIIPMAFYIFFAIFGIFAFRKIETLKWFLNKSERYQIFIITLFYIAIMLISTALLFLSQNLIKKYC